MSPDLPLRDGPAARDIQGNVLAPFRTKNVHFLMMRLPGDRARARAWLGDMTGLVSSSADVTTHQAGPRPRPPATWVALGLSAGGLERLGVPADGLMPYWSFRTGAAARARDLGDFGDSAPDQWRFGDPGHPVDAVVTIASDDIRGALAARRDRVGEIAVAHGAMSVLEIAGARLPDGREHFGFRDGLGQPTVRGFDAAGVEPGEFVLGWRSEQGSREAADLLQNASFQVVRQLEQDVEAWHRDARAGRDADAWGAERIGRTPDGVLLDPMPPAAHIHKTLPQMTGRRQRLLRRGIPYGAPDDAERGIVFNAFMADISQQFEVVQQMANHADAQVGPDAVIGAPDPQDPHYVERSPAVPAWPRYVTTRGTVYAVALSISRLAKIASGG